MTALVAWRMLFHEKGRSALAIAGILVAILLIFLQLGFYLSVPRGGMLFYNAMRFGMDCKDPGSAHHEQKYRERVIRQLHRRAAQFGFTLQEVETVS